MDPMMILMFALLAVLIFFMFRNSKKRQAAAQELQNNLRPGAEVMLNSGIFGTLEELEDGAERAIIRSGTTTLEVHRQAISKVVTPVDAPEEASEVAPDDDPEFGERVGSEPEATNSETETDTPAGEGEAPKE